MTDEIEVLKAELNELMYPQDRPRDPKAVVAKRDELRRVQMARLCGDGILYYDSNNSGGSWWLKDEDWKALEEAGWTVHWAMRVRTQYGVMWESGRNYDDDPLSMLERPKLGKRWPDKTDGFRSDDEILHVNTSYEEALENDARWLGALACSAAKAGPDPEALVAEFERLTGQNSGDEGCNCCGPPHSFRWTSPDGQEGYGQIEVTSRFTGFS